MKNISIFCAAVLFLVLASCSKATQQERVLSLNYPNASQREMPVKTGYVYTQGMTYTGKDGKMQTAPSYTFYLANFDLDTKDNGRYLNAPVKTNEQTKVILNLIGEEGDGPTSLPRKGSFSPKADKFGKVRMMTISARNGDKPEEFNLVDRETNGEVKISNLRSVAGENVIEGEINLTQGNLVIKGPFSAKMIGSGK